MNIKLVAKTVGIIIALAILSWTLTKSALPAWTIPPIFGVALFSYIAISKKAENEYPKFSTIFWLSIIASVVVVGINLFHWSLIEITTPFFQPLFEMIIYAIFTIILIWSLISSLRNFNKQKLKEFLPLSINLIALIIILFVPFTLLTSKMDFYFNLNQREKLIERIANKEIVISTFANANFDFVELPWGYGHISKGDSVRVQFENNTPNVFFFTFRGLIDNFSGFAYMADNTEPEKNDFGCLEFSELEKIKEHWFWLACT